VGKKTEIIKPEQFEQEKHYYPKVLNAQIHPLISYFIAMPKEALLKRYCHIHPHVKMTPLRNLIEYKPTNLRWAGADLFYVTTDSGERKMVLLETNSCPSGQKSMPLLNEHLEKGGYERLVQEVFVPLLKKKRLPQGALAVIYDKNYMESSGYAATLADAMNEQVYLVPCHSGVHNFTRFIDGILEIQSENGSWIQIRAAMRYVTQKPWTKIPLQTKTLIFNPIIGCLAGARNKLIAAKAYDFLNSELQGSGLSLLTPETIYDLSKDEIPLWIERFGGHAVIKIPYSNAGQGVFTITNKKELADFMEGEYEYSQFIVQSLIGNSNWSSHGKNGRFYHIGTIPNKRSEIFVADLRMMVMATADGFKPVACYARKSRLPLVDSLDSSTSSWDILGTNLSIKLGENKWDSDTNRLLIMDRKDFNSLGIGIDDLIEAYIQTILAVVAIDKMTLRLLSKNGQFRKKLFKSLNNDEKLFDEIMFE
jgi:hypothetical protein